MCLSLNAFHHFQKAGALACWAPGMTVCMTDKQHIFCKLPEGCSLLSSAVSGVMNIDMHCIDVLLDNAGN